MNGENKMMETTTPQEKFDALTNVKKLFFVLIAIILISGCNIFSPGEKNYDYHWKLSDSPVHIDTCFVVNEGETLKVDAGVEVLFKASEENNEFYLDSLNVGMMQIKGSIIAKGTKSRPILFHSGNEKGSHWGVILLDSTSTNNKFEYCTFRKYHRIFYDDNSKYAGAITFNKSTGYVTKCDFANNIHVTAIYCNYSSPLISYNYIHNTPFMDTDSKWPPPPHDIDSGTGIKCYNYSSPKIINNLIIGGFNSLICKNESNPVVINCTFAIVPGMTENALTTSGHSVPKIFNSILSCAGALSVECEDKCEMSHSLFYTSESDYIDLGGNIVTSNPHYETDSFRLAPDSPAINAGDKNISDLPIKDINGNSRIVGASIDMGAFEYHE